MMAQVFAKGFRADILRRILCFALFWHALDIIWVAIFSVVYLLGSARMSDESHLHRIKPTSRPATRTPQRQASARVLGYLVGLGLGAAADGGVVLRRRHRPGLAAQHSRRLVVLAIAQMGVHLVFFLHITTGPDNTNNVLALAFGVLIVFLVIGGSLWIMANLNHNMMPMDQIMQMQR